MADCIFCKIVRKEVPSNTVLRTDTLVAFEDLNPAAPIHVLVVPRKHIATMNDAVPSEANLLGEMLLCAKTVAYEKGLAENGYRLVMNCMAGAGQAVFHIHLHLLGGRSFQWPPG